MPSNTVGRPLKAGLNSSLIDRTAMRCCKSLTTAKVSIQMTFLISLSVSTEASTYPYMIKRKPLLQAQDLASPSPRQYYMHTREKSPCSAHPAQKQYSQ